MAAPLRPSRLLVFLRILDTGCPQCTDIVFLLKVLSSPIFRRAQYGEMARRQTSDQEFKLGRIYSLKKSRNSKRPSSE